VGFEESSVFIAMNRFRIARGAEETFEKLWRDRTSYLDDVPGFREFHLLRGPSDEEGALYASHTVWETRAAFDAWTESESFRAAHQQARAPAGTYLGHPRFEGFEVIL
jgi:heme-degrading monooxygenase HmoA